MAVRPIDDPRMAATADMYAEVQKQQEVLRNWADADEQAAVARGEAEHTIYGVQPPSEARALFEPLHELDYNLDNKLENGGYFLDAEAAHAGYDSVDDYLDANPHIEEKYVEGGLIEPRAVDPVEYQDAGDDHTERELAVPPAADDPFAVRDDWLRESEAREQSVDEVTPDPPGTAWADLLDKEARFRAEEAEDYHDDTVWDDLDDDGDER